MKKNDTIFFMMTMILSMCKITKNFVTEIKIYYFSTLSSCFEW